jgi:hypothetical protein
VQRLGQAEVRPGFQTEGRAPGLLPIQGMVVLCSTALWCSSVAVPRRELGADESCPDAGRVSPGSSWSAQVVVRDICGGEQRLQLPYGLALTNVRLVCCIRQVVDAWQVSRFRLFQVRPLGHPSVDCKILRHFSSPLRVRRLANR